MKGLVVMVCLIMCLAISSVEASWETWFPNSNVGLYYDMHGERWLTGGTVTVGNFDWKWAENKWSWFGERDFYVELGYARANGSEDNYDSDFLTLAVSADVIHLRDWIEKAGQTLREDFKIPENIPLTVGFFGGWDFEVNEEAYGFKINVLAITF